MSPYLTSDPHPVQGPHVTSDTPIHLPPPGGPHLTSDPLHLPPSDSWDLTGVLFDPFLPSPQPQEAEAEPRPGPCSLHGGWVRLFGPPLPTEPQSTMGYVVPVLPRE